MRESWREKREAVARSRGQILDGRADGIEARAWRSHVLRGRIHSLGFHHPNPGACRAQKQSISNVLLVQAWFHFSAMTVDNKLKSFDPNASIWKPKISKASKKGSCNDDGIGVGRWGVMGGLSICCSRKREPVGSWMGERSWWAGRRGRRLRIPLEMPSALVFMRDWFLEFGLRLGRAVVDDCWRKERESINSQGTYARGTVAVLLKNGIK